MSPSFSRHDLLSCVSSNPVFFRKAAGTETVGASVFSCLEPAHLERSFGVVSADGPNDLRGQFLRIPKALRVFASAVAISGRLVLTFRRG